MNDYALVGVLPADRNEVMLDLVADCQGVALDRGDLRIACSSFKTRNRRLGATHGGCYRGLRSFPPLSERVDFAPLSQSRSRRSTRSIFGGGVFWVFLSASASSVPPDAPACSLLAPTSLTRVPKLLPRRVLEIHYDHLGTPHQQEEADEGAAPTTGFARM